MPFLGRIKLKAHCKRKELIMAKKNNDDITFVITEHIGDISLASSGWKRELNMVSWNGNDPRFDLRSWSPDHSKCSRGQTFCSEEMQIIAKLLKDRF